MVYSPYHSTLVRILHLLPQPEQGEMYCLHVVVKRAGRGSEGRSSLEIVALIAFLLATTIQREEEYLKRHHRPEGRGF